MHRPPRWSHALLPALLASLPFLAGCGGGDSTAPVVSTQDIISSVTTFDGSLAAVYHTGTPPAAGSGPTITPRTTGATITGGSKLVAISSDAPYSTLIITVQGMEGYYEIDGVTLAALRRTSEGTAEAGTRDGRIIVTLRQSLPTAAFTVQLAGGTSASTLGPYATMPLSVTEVGTGDVQVSVSWDQPSDVDLHVLDPSGEEIFYHNKTVASGGGLDLDSNADCVIDNKNNENITWPQAKAPRGTYTVRIDYFLNCNMPATNYVVTVNVKGHPVETVSGTLTGTGDMGEFNAGKTVKTFTY